MAEKYAVLVKYKYLEYIESAGLSDTDAWNLMRGIIEYDKTEEAPVFENPVLTGIFAVIKLDLDQNKENYEAVSQGRSKAGKEGAKKRWGEKKNGKDSKSHDGIAKMANANGDSNCHNCQEKIAKMHDLDLDSEFEKEREEEPLPSFSKSGELNPKKDSPPSSGDPAMIFEKVKARWKEVTGQETRETLLQISYARRERFINTLVNYEIGEIFNAITNYHFTKGNPDDYDIGSRVYGNLYGFLENGVSQFFTDDVVNANFRRDNVRRTKQ
jgi:hypothetical protein